MSKAEFVTKGPIGNLNEQIYIERPEDAEILKAVRLGDYITLLGASQTGKTSLLYKLPGELNTDEINNKTVYVNLARFSGVKEDDWYNRVAETVVERLPQKLRDTIGEGTLCADQDQLCNRLREIANPLAGTDRLVFLLDEVETVPEEIREDFFGGVIRVIYNDKAIYEAFQKYIFVMSSSIPPAELMDPKSPMSPFNISRTIYMGDFNIEGVGELGENLRLHGFTIDDSVIEHIYDWTHGHPNLTQEIFARLVQADPEEVTEKRIDDLVDELVTKRCNNLDHIIRRVQDEAVNQQQVLDILNGKKMPFNLSNSDVLDLYLIGVIGEDEDGKCVIRNKIYEEALRSIREGEDGIETSDEEKESQIGKQLEISSLIMKITSDPRIYVPLIAISQIDPQSRTIMRIKEEVDKLIDTLERKIPDIRYKVPSGQKQLYYLALERLVKLGVIRKEEDNRYTLTEKGRSVLMEI